MFEINMVVWYVALELIWKILVYFFIKILKCYQWHHTDGILAYRFFLQNVMQALLTQRIYSPSGKFAERAKK